MNDQACTIKPRPGLLGWLGVPARLFVGGVFVYAAWAKIMPVNGAMVFSKNILAYKLDLPNSLVNLAAFGVPWTEAFAGIMLIIGFWTRAAAAVIVAMFLLFIGLGISAILRKLEINCGCFGEGTLMCPRGLHWCHVWENCFMTALALLVLVCPRPALALDNIIRFKWEGIRRK